ncbi:MAG: hypothetical protein E7493_02695 [Ruminococcus albus]|nr:hypothetical protein [Ruminococcus albus]
MNAILRRTTTMLCAAVMAMPMVFSANAVEPLPNDKGIRYDDYASISESSDYTLTIPATFNIKNSGWNEIGDISASGTLEDGKKLVVSAESENGWALKSGENSVGYTMKNAETDTDAADTWEFTNLPASQKIGVDVEEYRGKPAGSYTDTVTFTASVEDAAVAVTSLTLDKTSIPYSGGSLMVTVEPSTATDSTVIWKIPDVAHIYSDAEYQNEIATTMIDYYK